MSDAEKKLQPKIDLTKAIEIWDEGFEYGKTFQAAEIERLSRVCATHLERAQSAENAILTHYTHNVKVKELEREIESLRSKLADKDMDHKLIMESVERQRQLNDMQSEKTRIAEARREKLREALGMYAMTNETFPEYGDVARSALSEDEGE